MQSSKDYQELLKHQCNLTDLFRNQLQVTNFELQKARGTIQHLKAVFLSMNQDFNLKSEHLSVLLNFIERTSADDLRISILEENFKKNLTETYSKEVPFSDTKMISLPNDLLFLVLEYLEPKELTLFSYTCKEIYSMCQSAKLWKSLAESRWSRPVAGKSEFLHKYQCEMAWFHTRPVISTLLGHSGSVTCLAYIPGKSYFISGSDDCSLTTWEINESRLKDQEIVKQHHVQTKAISKKTCFYGHGGPVWSCVESPDNSLISSSYDKTIKIWNLNTGRCEFTMRGHNEWVSSVDCNSSIICSGSWDATVKIWDQATKQCISTLVFDQAHSVYCLQISDSNLLLGLKSRILELWDLPTLTKTHTFAGHFKGINTAKIVNNVVVSGSSDTLVKIWDARTAECVANLAGHTSNVMCLDYDSECFRIVTGSYDKTIRVWDMRKNNSARSVLRAHSDPVFCLKFDDHKLISGSMDQSIKIWNFYCI